MNWVTLLNVSIILIQKSTFLKIHVRNVQKINNEFNPLNSNRTKWSNILKQFVGKLPTNYLSVFVHFVKLALKGLKLNIKGEHTCSKSQQRTNNPTVYKKKQPSRGVLIKTCSENMQQIYRRTPMPKCDFNKVAKQLYWNHTLAWVFFCKFAVYFQNTFS